MKIMLKKDIILKNYSTSFIISKHYANYKFDKNIEAYSLKNWFDNDIYYYTFIVYICIYICLF